MNTKEIINILKEDGAQDKKAMLDALCDGAYLANKTWSEEEVEEAHAELSR